MLVQQGDKVFLGEKKTPFRVATMGRVNGEKAAGLCTSGDLKALNFWIKSSRMDSCGPVTDYVQIVHWIPIEDLVRDTRRRGWRERWKQLDLQL